MDFGSFVADAPGSFQVCRRRKFEPLKKTAQSKRRKNMNRRTNDISKELAALADDARALLAATGDVAGDTVAEARQRLGLALDRAKEIASDARDKAIESAIAADQAVRDEPYKAIAIALGIGAVLGFVCGCRCCRRSD
jgi:ElaB/YqjD/DUF883 family membrane-anchored ribosome-binding protein